MDKIQISMLIYCPYKTLMLTAATVLNMLSQFMEPVLQSLFVAPSKYLVRGQSKYLAAPLIK